MVAHLESILQSHDHIAAEGKEMAAAIETFNIGKVQSLLEREPGLVHAADERGRP